MEFSYAGFWKRVLAYFIDQIIISVVNTIIFIPMIFVLIGAGIFSLDGFEEFDNNAFTHVLQQDYSDGHYLAFISVFILVILLFAVFSLVVQWLYYALMESSVKQATLGKMALGIKVVDYSGNRISFGKASGRYFGKILSGMILCIGYLMAGFTEKKQALHDMLASCLVVDSQS